MPRLPSSKPHGYQVRDVTPTDVRIARLRSGAPYPTVFGMAGMYSMNDLLDLVAHEGAEEVHLEPDRLPLMLLQGKPRAIDALPVTSDNVVALLRSIATEEQLQELERCGNVHFTYVAHNSAPFSVSAAVRGENLSLRIKNLGR